MRTWPALDIQRADSEIGDLIQAFLLDFGVAAIDDESAPGISRVFFHDDDGRDRAAGGLRAQFPAVAVRALDVPDEDWAARSQASLRAIQVGQIIVAPPWDIPAGIRDSGLGIRDSTEGRLKPAPTNVGDGNSYVGAGIGRPIIIVIQPSMGFGTGHHATTRLCLAALQQIDLRGLRVLDVGTGSGVLAIAASRLGATTVAGIDDDPDAIESARDSLALNPEASVTLTTSDFRIPNPDARIPSPESRIPTEFDLVVANLTGGLLIAAAARLQSLAAPAGRLVISGFMDHEERDVLRAFEKWKVESRAQEDEWVCVTMTV